MTGVANVLAAASARALAATLVPWELLPSAIALRSIAFQGGTIAGPALGGLLFAIRAELVYVVATVLMTCGTIAVLLVHEPKTERTDGAPGWSTFLAGVRFSASNELGAFKSGVAAALLGAVPAVVLGGVATIVLAGVWRRLFPDLGNIDRIEELRPEPAGVRGAAL